MMFREKNFTEEIYSNRKYSDFEYNSWKKNEAGEECRLVTYKAQLSSKVALGASFASVFQTQTISQSSREPEMYIINCEIVNSDVPYADTFKIETHYCIKKEESSSDPKLRKCRIIYCATVTFKKPPFFVVRNIIEKSVYSGLEIIASDTVLGLEQEAENGSGNFTRAKSILASIRKMTSPKINHRIKCENREDSGSGRSSNICGWVILILLFLVFGMNVYLYTRMSLLDDIYKQKVYKTDLDRDFDASRLMKNSENFPYVLRSLKMQERIFERSATKWKHQLLNASQSLKQVEITLEEMLSSLPEYVKEHHRLAKLQATFQTLEEFREDVEASENVKSFAHQKSHIPKFQTYSRRKNSYLSDFEDSYEGFDGRRNENNYLDEIIYENKEENLGK